MDAGTHTHDIAANTALGRSDQAACEAAEVEAAMIQLCRLRARVHPRLGWAARAVLLARVWRALGRG